MDTSPSLPSDQANSSTNWLWWHGYLDKGKKHGAEERFASEALALAINADPSPFFRAISQVCLDLPAQPGLPIALRLSRLASLRDATEVRASTEYPVGTFAHGEGSIDIRLAASQPSGPIELWIEVKVGAPISGKQLFTYANARHHLRRTRPLFLVIAREHPCRGHDRTSARQNHEATRRLTLPCLEWSRLAKSIAEHEHPSIWEELRRYIESDILRQPEGW
jgi:hypothetical protein